MKIRIAFVALLAIAMLSVPLSAETHTQQMKANIPFQFYVGSKLMPAGDYIISGVAPKVTLLQLEKTGFHRVVLSHSVERKVSVTDAMLTFRHTGDRYFLRQIWGDNTSMGQELPNTKFESSTARNGSSHVVFVLARR